MSDVLSLRALNRATLARQHLLERVDMPVAAMVEHLVGMQAQVPRNPYLALWSRVEGFRAEDLEALWRAAASCGWDSCGRPCTWSRPTTASACDR